MTTDARRARRPSAAVAASFGVAPEDLVLLAGGQGTTWRADGIVLRPGGDREESDWKAGLLAGITHTAGFRTARPVPPVDGVTDGWTREGWEAWEWLPGTADESRLVDVIRAAAAFHDAIADVPRPAFIARVDDPWSLADRAVWDGEPLPRDPLLDALQRCFRPIESPSQLVHGDLLGNVLFSPDAPPAVIDWAPYWRAPALGAAIAAVDAACWHGLPASALGPLAELGPEIGQAGEWPQLLARALAFRMATLHLLGAWDDAMIALHRPVVAAVMATLDPS